MKKILSVILYLIIFIGVYAQQPMLRNFQVSDYRGGTQNWCIDMTNTNRLLVANNAGLLRYDSRWWQTFALSNFSNVRSILYDPVYNHVWAGGTNEFGCFEANIKTFANYHSISERLPKERQQFGEIWKILKLRDDYIFQAKKDLFFLHRDSTLSFMSTPFSIDCSAIIGDRLLVADETGIYAVENNKLSTPLPNLEELKGKTIYAILPYQQQMIICTTVDGLFIYDGNQTRPFATDLTAFLSNNQIFCAAIQNDLLAIGTIRDGLVLRNLKTGMNQYANTRTGLSNNTVLSIYFDRIDNVWLGLDQGIAYVMPTFPASYLIGKQSAIGAGYASIVYGNNLYMGTNQGLFTTPYPLSSSPTPPTPQLVNGMTGQIWSLNNINGTLLCGCNAGTYIINGQQARKIQGPEGTLCFLPLRHHPDYIIGSDYLGLFLLNAKDFSFVGRVAGFEECSGALLEDRDGSVWMSHWQKGIYRLTLSADARQVVKVNRFGKDNGLLVDAENQICQINGHILISSVDGLHYYNPKTGKLARDEKMSKVFDTYGTSLRLFETPAHDIWAYKANYLAIAHPKGNGYYEVDTLSYKGFVHELQMGLGFPHFITDKDQTILNSLNGFILANNKTTSKLYETKLKIELIESTNYGDSLLYVCAADTIRRTFRINHDNNSLRITFTMPEYMRPEEIEYSCWLEGYDHTWSDWQKGYTKDYTYLPKGKYTFHVKARNKMTGFEDEKSISIEILPAWYETWWAYTLYLLLIAGFAWMLTRWVQRRQDRKLDELRVQKEQEMRQQQAEFELEQQKKESELTRLRNEQLETELKHRQSELGDSTMNLMRKNDMLQALDTQLNELSESVRREDVKSKITQKIKDIRHDIQNNINEDEGWDKFEENFNLVYDNFMKRLANRFPDLKMNDRKLCAYLRMGLSSKEMASLLNTSVRSIETARYRLRKKLGMEQGDNLVEFIQTFEEIK